MARLITTGAESGSATIEGVSQSAAAPTLVAGAAHTGAFGYRSTSAGAIGAGKYTFKGWTGATSRDYFFQGWVRLSALPTGGKLGIFEFENGQGQLTLYVDSADNKIHCIHQLSPGAPVDIGQTSALSTATWYQIEARGNVVGAGTSAFEVYVNDFSIGSVGNASWGTAAPTTAVWGAYDFASSGVSLTGDVDWDDVAVNDATGAAPYNTWVDTRTIQAVPVVEGTAETAVTTAGTSHAITLPASIAATDMVLITMDIGSTAATVNALTDWAELLDENLANGLKVFQYTGAGIPSAPTFTTSAATRSASIAWRISGADKTITPQIGTTSTGTSLTPDPPAVAPTAGPASYRFITFAGMAGEEADDDTWGNTPPTNYLPSPPLQKACGTAGTNLGGLIVAASIGRTIDTEDPGTFNVDVSAAWRAQTIAVYAVPFVHQITAPVAGATGSAPVPVLHAGQVLTSPPAVATAAAPVPALAIPITVVAPAATATGVTVAPGVSAGATLTSPPATATGAAPVPVLHAGATLTSPPGAATGSGPVPVLHAGAILTSPPAAATGLSVAPGVSAGAILTAPPATATGASPTTAPHAGAILSPAAAPAIATAPVPSLSTAGGPQTVFPPPAIATASAPVPSATSPGAVTAPAATATGSALVPSLSAGVLIAPGPAGAIASAPIPGVTAPATVTAPAAIAVATGLVPSVGAAVFVNAPAAVATASAPAATVHVPAGVVAPPATATASAPVSVLHAGVVLGAPPALATARGVVPIGVGVPVTRVNAPAATAVATAIAPGHVGPPPDFTIGLPSDDTYPTNEFLPTGEQLGYTP